MVNELISRVFESPRIGVGRALPRPGRAQGRRDSVTPSPRRNHPDRLVPRSHAWAPLIAIAMGSSESPTYGKQEGSAYNGHIGFTCYHPLFFSISLASTPPNSGVTRAISCRPCQGRTG